MNNELDQQSSKIAVFKGKQIRKTIHQGEWFFSIVDIAAILTESPNPRRYWSDLKIQVAEKEGFN
jgi:DNA-damage-inducible protein D